MAYNPILQKTSEGKVNSQWIMDNTGIEDGEWGKWAVKECMKEWNEPIAIGSLDKLERNTK